MTTEASNVIILEVLNYNYNKVDGQALFGDIRGKKIAGFMTAFYPLPQQSQESSEFKESDVASCEVIHSKTRSFRTSKSNDSKLYNGCSFVAPHCPGTLYGIKLQLYALNKIDIVDIGNCKWKPNPASSLLERGYKVEMTLPIIHEGAIIYSIDCRLSIARSYASRRPLQPSPHDNTSSNALIPPPKFLFQAPTNRVNWRRIQRLELKEVVELGQVEPLLACRDDVSSGDLTAEDIDIDPQLRKCISLAQYSVQYLHSCGSVLERRLHAIEEATNAFQHEENTLDLHIALLRAKESALRSECASLEETRQGFCALLGTVSPRLGDMYEQFHRSQQNVDQEYVKAATRHALFEDEIVAGISASLSVDLSGPEAADAAASHQDQQSAIEPSSPKHIPPLPDTTSPTALLIPPPSSSPTKASTSMALNSASPGHSVSPHQYRNDAVGRDGASYSAERGAYLRERDDDHPMQASISFRGSTAQHRASVASVMSTDSLGVGALHAVVSTKDTEIQSPSSKNQVRSEEQAVADLVMAFDDFFDGEKELESVGGSSTVTQSSAVLPQAQAMPAPITRSSPLSSPTNAAIAPPPSPKEDTLEDFEDADWEVGTNDESLSRSQAKSIVALAPLAASLSRPNDPSNSYLPTVSNVGESFGSLDIEDVLEFSLGDAPDGAASDSD